MEIHFAVHSYQAFFFFFPSLFCLNNHSSIPQAHLQAILQKEEHILLFQLLSATDA